MASKEYYYYSFETNLDRTLVEMHRVIPFSPETL